MCVSQECDPDLDRAPSGEVQFIHPKDGVFPEKVNAGRIAVGKREFSIGKNPNPASIKFTGTETFES